MCTCVCVLSTGGLSYAQQTFEKPRALGKMHAQTFEKPRPPGETRAQTFAVASACCLNETGAWWCRLLPRVAEPLPVGAAAPLFIMSVLNSGSVIASSVAFAVSARS